MLLTVVLIIIFSIISAAGCYIYLRPRLNYIEQINEDVAQTNI